MEQLTWGDIVTLEYGKGLRGYESGRGEYRVYGTNGPVGWHSAPLCPTAGIVVGRKGAYRGVHFSKAPFYVIDTAFWVKPKRHFDILWAYYSLLELDINSMDSGSAIPSTSRDEFYRQPVLVPDVAQQGRISGVLGALDDKIELNRKMNETLEAMARALFKSWFVDFDPVRAKAEGRPTGLPADLDALFPSEFEDSSLGEIPKGWVAGVVSDFFQVNPTRSLRAGALAPYLDMKNMPTQGHEPTELRNREVGSGAKFVNGDTLLARITPCLENGKTAFVDFLDEAQTGWGSTEYIVIRPVAPLPLETAYLLARDEDFRDYSVTNMSGSSGRQRVPSGAVERYPFVKPTAGVCNAFGQYISPIFEQVKSNVSESRSLSAIRDFLLPRLLTGEVDVAKAAAGAKPIISGVGDE